MKKLITMVVVLAMLMTMSTTVFAADPVPEAVVTGGTLANTELGIAAFTPVTLDGTTTTTAAVVADTILTDSRGLGDGWQVSLKASPFINATTSAAVGADLTLPGSSLELGTVSIAIIDAGSTAATNITKATLGKLDTEFGINILSAPLNEGMGTYTVSMEPMTLTLLPKSTYAGTYSSTVTETLTTGPVA
ncbi:MAG TPA: WxL domain-containing protein [Anaerovoracaceae bacterium]|nr:WxL domain-containing protein [Anaerovoracaceae bacterium]